ncbi:Golgin A5 domain containing protein [Trichuris trichiura]|uniref:Golgin A5 domain containing protein n=1 Tax=Trichuris trichiura TaxID=36087 RepID=A0A077YX76_TRITR|nr:Golgin A5 domain containing protein [Trichuris trichiura]
MSMLCLISRKDTLVENSTTYHKVKLHAYIEPEIYLFLAEVQYESVTAELFIASEEFCFFNVTHTGEAMKAKESTIMALKQDSGEMDSSAQTVSFEELRAERDILKEELEKTVTSLNKLKADVQNSESQRMADQRASMQRLHQLEEELQTSRLNSSHYRLQLRQLEQEAKGATEEVNNLQRTLQVKLQEKDAEIKRLSREIIAAPSKTEGETETEQRLKQLMESLIKKQNMIESLQTDKHSLMLQLERVEHMYREAESAAIRATYNSQNQGGHNGSASLSAVCRLT